MEFFNSLNLTQIKGGTKLKQGDFGSVLSYSLTDENGQEITSFDTKTAYANLVLDDKILFTTTAQVDISRVTFNIDKAIPTGLYYLEIKIDDYIFPSDKDSIILIEAGSVAYDLKDLVPNYDTNMTIKGILSDLSQKGIDINDLKTKMSAIYNNALADHAEIMTARGGFETLSNRLSDINHQIKNVTSGSPKGAYASLSALQTAKPNGDSGIYVTTDNGHWWYYNGAWLDGGVYQSEEIGEKAVNIENLSDELFSNILLNPTLPNAELYTSKINSSVTNFVYIEPNVITRYGKINLEARADNDTQIKFLLLKKNTNGQMTISQIVEAVATKQIAKATLMAEGTGNEYVGIMANPNIFTKSFAGTESQKFFGSNTTVTPAVDTTFDIHVVNQDMVALYWWYDTGQIEALKDVLNLTTVYNSVQKVSEKVLANTKPLSNLMLNDLDESTWTSWGNRMKLQNIEFNAIKINVKLPKIYSDLIYILDIRNSTSNVLESVRIDLSGEDLTLGRDLVFKFNNIYNLKDGLYLIASTVNSSNILVKTSLGLTMTSGFDENSFTGNSDSIAALNSTGLYPQPLNMVGYGNTKGYTQFPYKLYVLNGNADDINVDSTAIDYIARKEIENLKNTELDDVEPLGALQFEKTIGNFPSIPNVWFNGRWAEKNGYPTTINQGSSLFAKFKGTSISGTFSKANSVDHDAMLAVRIDNGAYTRIKATNNQQVLASNLSDGVHIIEVVLDGIQEKTTGIWAEGNGISFKGFNIETTAIKPRNKTILYFGDSITEGVNVLAGGANPDVNSAYQTYAGVASRLLNVNDYRVGFGGTGMTKSGSGGVPKALDYLNYIWSGVEDPEFYPDLIVINHGTNDINATDDDFKIAYREFIKQLSVKYSGTRIFCMRPFNGTKGGVIKQVAAEFKHCYYVDTSDITVSTSDGTHPDVAGHFEGGRKLADSLVGYLGADYFNV